jgi:hypothetical protein
MIQPPRFRRSSGGTGEYEIEIDVFGWFVIGGSLFGILACAITFLFFERLLFLALMIGLPFWSMGIFLPFILPWKEVVKKEDRNEKQ